MAGNPRQFRSGIFQGIRNEVNLNSTKNAGVDVVRRMTGGGAVYHDYFGEVTYSIIGKVEIIPGEHHQFL